MIFIRCGFFFSQGGFFFSVKNVVFIIFGLRNNKKKFFRKRIRNSAMMATWRYRTGIGWIKLMPKWFPRLLNRCVCVCFSFNLIFLHNKSSLHNITNIVIFALILFVTLLIKIPPPLKQFFLWPWKIKITYFFFFGGVAIFGLFFSCSSSKLYDDIFWAKREREREEIYFF